MQKILFLVLCAVLAIFVYELQYGKGGINDAHHLNDDLNSQIKFNQSLRDRNNTVEDHLEELKGSPTLIEARSRRELGLIKANEILIEFPPENGEK